MYMSLPTISPQPPSLPFFTTFVRGDVRVINTWHTNRRSSSSSNHKHKRSFQSNKPTASR